MRHVSESPCRWRKPAGFLIRFWASYLLTIKCIILSDHARLWGRALCFAHNHPNLPVASLTTEVNQRLAKRQLVFNGRLVNRRINFLSKRGHGLPGNTAPNQLSSEQQSGKFSIPLCGFNILQNNCLINFLLNRCHVAHIHTHTHAHNLQWMSLLHVSNTSKVCVSRTWPYATLSFVTTRYGYVSLTTISTLSYYQNTCFVASQELSVANITRQQKTACISHFCLMKYYHVSTQR